DRRIVRFPFDPTVPRGIVVVPVAVVLAVRVVVLFGIGDQIAQREAVMYGQKVDAVARLAPGEIEDLGRAGHLARQRPDLAGAALPELADFIAIGVVVFLELLAELAEAIPARARI